MTAPVCPYCGLPSALTDGAAIYPHRPDLRHLYFWRCKPCQAYVGCHPGGTRPLGRLADAELRRAKGRAHVAFDPLWRGGGMRRRDAYQWLAEQLGIPFAECHIGQFNLPMCERVVAVCRARARE